MEVAWPTPRCILCGVRDEITKEHVIPSSIGGRLVARFLCRACNSTLGRGAESAIKKDPAIRKSIERLGLVRPDLRDELQEGLKYIGRSGLGEVPGVLRKGRFVAQTRPHDDGSLIVPPSSSFAHVTRMAASEGGSPLEVTANQLRNLPLGDSVEAAPGIFVTNWVIDEIKPDLDRPEIDHVVPAIIAFEFLALHCGDEIYENPTQLASIRKQLLDGSLSKGDIRVQRLMAKNIRLFHGLVFEGNEPGAQIQIRLFGSLAFRVEFPRVAVHCTRFGYTHDLVAGDDAAWVVT